MAQEVMMVAAHNYNLRAARSHGMRTASVARAVRFHNPKTAAAVKHAG